MTESESRRLGLQAAVVLVWICVASAAPALAQGDWNQYPANQSQPNPYANYPADPVDLGFVSPILPVRAQHPLLEDAPSQIPPHPSASQYWQQADFYPPIPTESLQPPFNLSVMPYYSDMGYDASLKDRGHMWGLYTFLARGNHEYEIGAEFLDIKFKNGGAVTQTDLIGTWSYYLGDSWKTRLGTHVIDSSDRFSDNGWVLFAGLSQYETGDWEAGMHMTVSHYEDYAPVVTLYQFSPKVTKTLATFNDFTLTGEGYIYYIYSDEEIGLGQQSFWSAEGRLYLSRDPVTLMLYGWAGQQTFAVRNDGFILFNLNESHEGGYGAELRLKIDHMNELRLKMGVELFEDFTTRVSAIQHTFNIYWLLSF